MAKKNYDSLVEEINKLIGGRENVTSFTHCITRLRFYLKDRSLLKKETIEKLDGVVGSQWQGDQFQIIIGTDVNRLYDAFLEVIPEYKNVSVTKVDEKGNKDNKIDSTSQVPTSWFSKFTVYTADIFIPLVPCLAGAGIIQATLSLGSYLNFFTADSGLYIVLDIIQKAVFTFLPFLVGLGVAKKLKANEFYALVMAGILMSPVITQALAEGVTSYSLFGIPVVLADSSSTVIPIILSVIVQSQVQKFFDKVIHPNLRMMLSSGLTFVVTGIITLIVFAPLGTFIGNRLSDFINWILSVSAILGGAILGALHLLMVITGTHFIEIPLIIQEMSTGNGTAIMAITSAGNTALLGALVALWIKTKSTKKKDMVMAVLPSTFFGATEPALYGIAVVIKKVLFAAVVGGGVGGLIIALSGFKMTVIGAPSFILAGLANIANPGGIWFLVGSIAGIIVAFIIVFIGYKDVERGDESV